MISRRIFLFLALGAALAACAPDEPEFKYLNYPIINGTPDTSQAHMAVVGIRSQFGQCSGTLIHHRVVMTAAHCVDGDTAAQIAVGFGNDINWGSGAPWVSVVDKWQHPSYTGDSNDIALVRMTALAPVAVTPIPHLPESLQITTADIGRTAEYVGFGMTDPYDENSSGIKMTMTNQIEWVCYSASCSGWDNPGRNNTFCEDQSPSGVCFGDSGGPAFITRSGTEYAAGVASYVGSNCQSFGCHTKVDEYEYYILDFIAQANGATCYYDSECESNICSDGICCSADCNGACMACDLPGSLGQCRAAPDGYECPDSNPCDGAETCQNGVCTDGPDLDCDDNNACTTDTCNPATGCVHTPAGNGTPCNDGLYCTVNDICTAGACSGGARDCSAWGDDCHHGVCNDGTDACESQNKTDGTPCDDGLYCTVGDQCTGGACGGSQRDCSDGDDCTFESCHPVNGCQYTPAPEGTACGDNKDCTGSNSCVNGVCLPGSGAVCDDGNACTYDQCIPGTGCVYDDLPDSTPCADGNPCTTSDVCQSGICAGSAVDCDDHNPCTADSCDLAAGCVHTRLADGTGCGGGQCGQAVCVEGVCEPVSGSGCDDHDPCTDDWCDPELGCMHDRLPDGWECGKCYLCIGGQCMQATDCGEEGCGCGYAGHELPLWGGLLVLALLVIRRRR